MDYQSVKAGWEQLPDANFGATNAGPQPRKRGGRFAEKSPT